MRDFGPSCRRSGSASGKFNNNFMPVGRVHGLVRKTEHRYHHVVEDAMSAEPTATTQKAYTGAYFRIYRR
jgi:hypothetical protein